MTTTPQRTLDALAASGAQTGREMLDAARTEKFTGEIIVHGSTETQLYFDNGLAYHAKRPHDPTLCERLLEAEVITPAQVERGVVRVGNIENLGRLFDRDPSIDRDAVMVVVELATDDVVTDVANRPAVHFTTTAYRHHKSGVHRWFVAPDDPLQLVPVGEVNQIDASVTTDLPTIAAPNDDVRIEWNAPLDASTHPEPSQGSALHSLDDAMLQSILDDDAQQAAADFDPDRADWTASVAPTSEPLRSIDDIVTTAPEPSADASPSTTDDSDFQIVWPDGTEQELPADIVSPPALVAEPQRVDPVIEPVADADITVGSDRPALEMPELDLAVIETAHEHGDTPVATDSDFTFAMPSLTVDANNTPTDEQPDDVVDAVRRALDAIESASDWKPALPSMEAALPALSPIAAVESPAPVTATAPAVVQAAAPAPVAAAAPTPTPVEAVAAAPFGGFAPPSLENSAEAVYARMAEAQAEPTTAAAPAAGVASVVFVDEHDGDANERSGALRRLIGGLRRK